MTFGILLWFSIEISNGGYMHYNLFKHQLSLKQLKELKPDHYILFVLVVDQT
jgi:hypothetical protein